MATAVRAGARYRMSAVTQFANNAHNGVNFRVSGPGFHYDKHKLLYSQALEKCTEPVRRQLDCRPLRQLIYIRSGTAIPSVASAEVRRRRAISATAIKHRALRFILLSDYTMAMVEEVKGASERECILGEVRRFGGRGTLRNHFIKPLSQHHQ